MIGVRPAARCLPRRAVASRAANGAVIAAVIAVIGAGAPGTISGAEPIAFGAVPGSEQEGAAPSARDAAQATYSGIYEIAITLEDGRYEGEPFVPGGAARPTVGLLQELQVVADLDGDGSAERLVWLWENSGGSGTNLYLARLHGNGSGQAVFVGNHVQVRGFGVEAGIATAALVRAGDADAMCCPRELATVRWRPAAGGLEVDADVVTGRMGLPALAGEWHLAHVDADAPFFDPTLWPAGSVAGGLEVTLVIGPDGAIYGSGGCNRYSGAIELRDASALTVGPVVMTRMACAEPAMELEQGYGARLQAASSVGFHMGRLAISWNTEDGRSGLLLFAPSAQ